MLKGLEEMGSDEDEETRRWEEEQILKGVKASAPDQVTPATSVPSHLSSIDQSFLVGVATGYVDGASYMTPSYVSTVQSYAGYTDQVAETTIASSNSFRVPEKLVPITVESLKSRLSNQLCDLQDSASSGWQRLGQTWNGLRRKWIAQRTAEEGWDWTTSSTSR